MFGKLLLPILSLPVFGTVSYFVIEYYLKIMTFSGEYFIVQVAEDVDKKFTDELYKNDQKNFWCRYFSKIGENTIMKYDKTCEIYKITKTNGNTQEIDPYINIKKMNDASKRQLLTVKADIKKDNYYLLKIDKNIFPHLNNNWKLELSSIGDNSIYTYHQNITTLKIKAAVFGEPTEGQDFSFSNKVSTNLVLAKAISAPEKNTTYTPNSNSLIVQYYNKHMHGVQVYKEKSQKSSTSTEKIEIANNPNTTFDITNIELITKKDDIKLNSYLLIDIKTVNQKLTINETIYLKTTTPPTAPSSSTPARTKRNTVSAPSSIPAEIKAAPPKNLVTLKIIAGIIYDIPPADAKPTPPSIFVLLN